MSSDWIDDAKEFICLYYNFLVTIKKDIYKFYHPDAVIKTSFSEHQIPVSKQLFHQIGIPPDSELNILKYSIVPFNEFCNITVIFNIKYNDHSYFGSQCFTLNKVDDRIYIVADYQNYQSPPEYPLTEFFPYQKIPLKNKKQKANKYSNENPNTNSTA
ncbi:hypothetical protein TVAG_470990 [Trichomonas vaginalis G3]|uniref:NTF2 domain-containing protein n=1 Tax=Trichomonas vaginalis (strain ATCC PRA-98 / G3) TaxID=412133 RepID=A2F4Q5_TRIV3|nr:hypothetical protein TVAGG3_0225900 [Trichomonas vaginalis G3]EAY00116.1 hypothetical protein TVAG_470990 [Trichomonas vaginalis G3]KAI5552269.1 hypothetical protein TVAGG3_0225900 [Trichomonas vaginalis G3]|eukprot:XP_001313045.1 hypothetical protein [Trichomonas vaginalis G3]